MKKKEINKLIAEQINLPRSLAMLMMMQQHPDTFSPHAGSEPNDQLSELLRDASAKAESDKVNLQLIYNEIDSLNTALLKEKEKRKKLEKKLQCIDSKWSKRFKKTEKDLTYMEEIIHLITTYTGRIKGDTLPSILKSLRKNLYERKGYITQ